MQSRRGFLGLLGAFAAGAVLDPERLLWIPGAKTISIPAPRVRGFDFHHDMAFLAVGDVVTFGDWPERYIVTEMCKSLAEITDARFAQTDALPRRFPTSIRRIGDTVYKSMFRETMTLLPENLRRWRALGPYKSAFPSS
jgi:hypothetical protein